VGTRIQLIEAFGAFLLLTILAVASAWDCYEYTDDAVRETSVTHSTWELQHLFDLDDTQTTLIRKINYEFYDKVSDAYAGDMFDDAALEAEINAIMDSRQERIMGVLNEYQKSKWEGLSLGNGY
jgi:ligand-binding SRPBCC domain-containing protein